MTDTPSKSSAPVFQPGTSDAEIEAAAALAARRRYYTVYFWRYFILVAFLGGWQLAVGFKLIDPFFFSSPWAIVLRLQEWIVDGTSEGPLWFHLWVTMEESLLGFFSGSIAGIIAGLALCPVKVRRLTLTGRGRSRPRVRQRIGSPLSCGRARQPTCLVQRGGHALLQLTRREPVTGDGGKGFH